MKPIRSKVLRRWLPVVVTAAFALMLASSGWWRYRQESVEAVSEVRSRISYLMLEKQTSIEFLLQGASAALSTRPWPSSAPVPK